MYKERFYVSVEVSSEDEARRLKKVLKLELPIAEVFVEVDKENAEGEIIDTWEIQ